MSRKVQIILLATLVLFAVCLAEVVLRLIDQRSSAPAALVEQKNCDRIVSLAPSITEILYAIGAGDRIVGVTRYCQYPDEARNKPRVGGYFDLNYEAVLQLNPSLIIMLAEHEQPRAYFKGLGLDFLTVDHQSLEQIMTSIQSIGRTCGCEDRARSLLADIHREIAQVQAKVSGKPRPTVLISVDRNIGNGNLRNVSIVGKDGFYDKLVDLAGGRNAYQGGIRFPAVSQEGVIKMNPDVILELAPQLKTGFSRERLLADWRSLPQIEAVQRHQIFLLTEDYVAVPGPRFVRILERIANLLHPNEP